MTASENIIQEFRDCPLCETERANSSETEYSQLPWRIVQCRACGFVYSDAAPPQELLCEEIAWEVSHAAESAKRTAKRPFLKPATAKIRNAYRRMFGRRQAHTILEKFATPGAVLDLGAGNGMQLSNIGDDFTPFGIEISAELAKRAKTLFSVRGGDCVNASAADGLRNFTDGFFTAASLRSYLEHESQPKKILSELHRTLKSDAIVLIKVPNFASWNRKMFGRDWCGFRLPDHLNYFTPQTLSTMTGNCGYVVKKLWASPFNDNLWMLLRRTEQKQ